MFSSEPGALVCTKVKEAPASVERCTLPSLETTRIVPVFVHVAAQGEPAVSSPVLVIVPFLQR
jgi:hypothetical protein